MVMPLTDAHATSVPIIPGHASVEEALAFLFNPATQIGTELKTLAIGVSQDIVAMADRREVVLQVQTGGPVWVNIGGTPAVVGTGFKLLGEMTLKIASNIPLSIISGAVSTVYVLQLGVQ